MFPPLSQSAPDGAGLDFQPDSSSPVHSASFRFRLDQDLGLSEWGRAWKATDLETACPVFLLDLHPALQHSKRILRAIRDGIQRAESIRDPRMAAIRQLLVVGTRKYLVGDPVTGVQPLVPLPPDGLLPLVSDLATILDPLFDAHTIHGNLRRSSFFLTPDNRLAVLAGFGLPFLPVKTANRPSFPPELAFPRWRPDSASDQYDLAAALYALLTGTPPPPPSSVPPLLRLPPACPPAFLPAFQRALSPRPSARFASIGDFADALAGHRVARRRPPSRQERRALLRRRLSRLLFSLAVSALLALLAFAIFAIISLRNEPPPVLQGPKIDLSLAVPLPPPVLPLQNCPPLATSGSDWVSSDGMEFIWVAPLGCWVGRFEVTQEEYRWQVPEHKNKPFRHLPMDGPRQPAVCINFREMTQYADWLTQRESALGRIPENWWFRLPTRREAIDFSLAGRTSPFPWGSTWPPPVGNFADASFHQEFPDLPYIADCRDTHPVSAPVEESGENDWGLFGTCGNVWETCVADETAQTFGGWHGGAFDDARPERCGAQSFYGYLGTARGVLNGFRLLLAPRPLPPP